MTDSGILTQDAPTKAAVVSKAVIRAAAALGLNNAELARILGVSAATITRLKKGERTLEADGKAYELALLLIRLYRGLDSITGDDESTRSWVRGANLDLHARPIDLIATIPGLTHTVAYVDSFRARI